MSINRRDFIKSTSLVFGSSLVLPKICKSMVPEHLNNEVPVSDFCKKLMSPGKRILELEGWNVWCCSPIYGPDGKVHVFFSRWPGEHDNWLKSSEIAHAVADHPEGPYQIIGTVLKGRGPGFWDADTIHNPTIHQVGDKYWLFYIGNNLAEAQKLNILAAGTQRIGLAVSDSLYGPWKRAGNDGLILNKSQEKKQWDSFMTTNPAFLKHPNGQNWLYYKAWDYNNDKIRKMGVAFSNTPGGPYHRYEKNPIIDFSYIKKEVEDAYMWYEDNRFHAIMRDFGVFSDRSGLYMNSSDGLNWSKPQLGYYKSDHYFPSEPIQRFERPQLLIKNGKPEYLYLAITGGKAGTSSSSVLQIG